jgi:hypothetical protein
MDTIEAKHAAKRARKRLEFRMELIRTVGSVCTIINVILSLVLTTRVMNQPVQTQVTQPVVTQQRKP